MKNDNDEVDGNRASEKGFNTLLGDIIKQMAILHTVPILKYVHKHSPSRCYYL